MTIRKEEGESPSPGFRIVLIVALTAWGIIYTFAYVHQESKVEAIQITVSAFETRINLVSADQRMLLTYVITLREQLSKTGFEVPPMPPLPSEEAAIEITVPEPTNK